MMTVYCFTFRNGKKYVGITNNFRRRLISHISISNNNSNRMLVTKAINKYKIFSVDILAICSNEKSAQLLEVRYIQEFNSIKNGYNQTIGGEGSTGYKHTNESKLKISRSSKTRVRSVDERKKLSRSRKSLNIKMSQESIIKMSKSKGVRPFVAIHASSNEVSQLFESVSLCAKYLKLRRSHISSCLHGKRSQHGGYRFEYKE